MSLNCKVQYYKGLPLQLISRGDYSWKQAKRFAINNTSQNVWIPNKHLLPNGTILDGENLDYIFVAAKRKLELAGFEMGFVPLKRAVAPSIRQKQRQPYNRTHPSFKAQEEEPEHPEVNSMDDYYNHYQDQPY